MGFIKIYPMTFQKETMLIKFPWKILIGYTGVIQEYADKFDTGNGNTVWLIFFLSH